MLAACETCGEEIEDSYTGRCYACGEVEARLPRYLRRGGKRAVEKLLAAISQYEADKEDEHADG